MSFDAPSGIAAVLNVRDRAFAVGLLTVLRHRAGELAPDVRATLLTLATSTSDMTHKDREKALKALKALFNLQPALVRSVNKDNMIAHSMLPLCIWASEEEPAKMPSGLTSGLALWGTALAGEYKCHLENCVRALNMTHALLEELTAAQAQDVAAFWQNSKFPSLCRNAYTLRDDQLMHWKNISVQLGLLHESVAALGERETQKVGEPSCAVRWANTLGDALGAMTNAQQESCVLYWAASNLSPTAILRACKKARPEVWLQPDVVIALESFLPKNEVVRWAVLPWAQRPRQALANHARFEPKHMADNNQKMMQLYCPEAASVLDVFTTPEMWLNRKGMAQTIAQFRKKSSPPDALVDVGEMFDAV